MSDGALLDTRVLLAHRLGADEAAWPTPEDRFASDLLLADRVRDPWLAELTAAAASAPVPVAARRPLARRPGPAARARGRRAVIERRLEPFPDPEAVGEDAELADAIRAEIAANGPITFARFMDRALYEPGHGYYRRAAAGPGRDGDFLTAPEAHPIFGAAIGRLLEQAWDALGRPDAIHGHGARRRHGRARRRPAGRAPGDGLTAVRAIRYHAVEVEPARLDALRARLAADGLDDALVGAPGGTGAVVANEVLDALPVHRVVGRPGGLRELLVATGDDGGFAWHEAEPTTPALADRLASEGVELADGQVTEVCLALDDWLAGAVDASSAASSSSSTTRRSPPSSTGRPTPPAPSAPSPATRSARTRSGTSAGRTSRRRSTSRRSARRRRGPGLEPLGETTPGRAARERRHGRPHGRLPSRPRRHPPGRPRPPLGRSPG